MNHFRIAFGGAAILSLAMVFAFPRASGPTVPEPIVVEAVDEGRFDEAWRDTMKVVALRSVYIEPPAPKAVVTERIMSGPIVPDAVEVASVAALPELDKPAARRRRHAKHRDVCARHNLRKVTYGKKWRCRK